MARIRNVKPAFFRHEDLFKAEKTEKLPLRLSFCGLWTCCDVNGVFQWRPGELKLDVLPYDTDVDFSAVLEALLRHRFIRKFELEGTPYGQVPTLKKHQHFVGKEAKSRGTYPLPDGGELPEKLSGSNGEVLIHGSLEVSGDLEISGGTFPECPGLDIAAWSLWLDYRKRSGRPLKQVSIPAAQRKLSAFGTNQHDVVEQSIANGWQGLFDLKPTVSRGTKNKFDRTMEALHDG